ncbi:MAG: tRNA 2-thiocytidine(32) synthetase TtcA [Oligoflexus sp.]
MSQVLEKIRKQMVAAIADYQMLSHDDRVLVAVSGGKDSAILLLLLNEVRSRAPFPFTIVPVMLDQKQPGFDAERFSAWIKEKTEMDLLILEEDTYSIVKDKVAAGKSFCGLCSRLRRGVLYNYAHEQGFTKIALGHHRDDLNETLLLNLWFNGSIASMPPKLLSDDGRNMVIRPLAYVAEASLEEAASQLELPVIPCNLCGSQENLQRARIKRMLKDMSADFPAMGASMLKAQQNVRKSQLADKNLWSFDF